MNSKDALIKNRLMWSKIGLAVGVLIIVAGLIAQLTQPASPYNLRLITGLGIVITGLSLGNWVLYRAANRKDQGALRTLRDEQDERIMQIKGQAGLRAYLVSAAMVFIGTIWSAFADQGSLPELAGNTLWYFLVAALVIPLLVYLLSMVLGERNN